MSPDLDQETASGPASPAQAATVMHENAKRLYASILREARRLSASEVRVEPAAAGSLEIRYRVEDVLTRAGSVSVSLAAMFQQVVREANDLTRRSGPGVSEGGAEFEDDGALMRVRCASLPLSGDRTAFVLRLQDWSAGFDLGQLMTGPALAKWHVGLNRTGGLALVCGPRGCGKTTLAYATLSQIASPTRATLNLDALGVDVAHVTCVDTSASLPDIVRAAAPDAVYTGNMRTASDARDATSAAGSGVLVLSELLVAGGAPQALQRLAEFDVAAGVVADTVAVVAVRRLVAKLCGHCRLRGPDRCPDGHWPNRTLAEWEEANATGLYWANPDGCEHCSRGYDGRVALHEILTIGDAVSSAVRSSASPVEVANSARGNRDMHSMFDDIRWAISNGLTDRSAVLASIDL